MLHKYRKGSLLFFVEDTIKVAKKVSSVDRTLNIALAVCKRTMNIYDIPYTYDSISNFLSVYQTLRKFVIPCK